MFGFNHIYCKALESNIDSRCVNRPSSDEGLIISLIVLFFFFSSRRRHTRFDCDWSSDVCSSDLRARDLPLALLPGHGVEAAEDRVARVDPALAVADEPDHVAIHLEIHGVRAERSEEHTSELQSQSNLVCRLLLEKKNKLTYKKHQ